MTHSLAYYVMLLRKDFTEYCSQKLQEIGLSQGLLFFILYIGKHPGCSPKGLGEALKMDSGHVARSLTKLVQAGFIFQEQNQKDRRAHILRLTAKGEEAFELSHALFFQWDREVLKDMDEEEQKLLLGVLERLTEGTSGGNCRGGGAEHGI